MPKSVEPIKFKAEGYTYELTDTLLREPNEYYNNVRLKDIAKAWVKPKALEECGVSLGERSQFFSLERRPNGSMNIGCRHFGPATTAMILREAGVRVASAKKKSKKKARSRSSKR